MLRIVRISGSTQKWSFSAEDVFTGEPVTVSLSGKMVMNFGKEFLTKGDECVAEFSPHQPTIGRVVTPSQFKMDLTNDGWIEQGALAARYEAEIGPYTTDYYWIKRAIK